MRALRRKPLWSDRQHFLAGLAETMGPWRSEVSSGTLADSNIDDGTVRGVVALGTSTSASGVSLLRTSFSAFTLGRNLLSLEARLAVNALATEAEDYAVTVGFLDAAAENGALFHYTRADHGSKWACMALDDGDDDEVVSAIAPTIGSSHFQYLRIDIHPGTPCIARFHIDEQLVGVLPVPAVQVGGRVRMAKSAGNTARSLLIDELFLQELHL